MTDRTTEQGRITARRQPTTLRTFIALLHTQRSCPSFCLLTLSNGCPLGMLTMERGAADPTVNTPSKVARLSGSLSALSLWKALVSDIVAI